MNQLNFNVNSQHHQFQQLLGLKMVNQFNHQTNVTIHSESDGTQTLVFQSTQLTDKASYTCQATNIGGTTEVKLNLNVQQIKPTLKADLAKDIVAKMVNLFHFRLKHQVQNHKLNGIKMVKKLLSTVEEEWQIEEEETYTLLMKRAQPKDSGEYQAVISE